METVVRIHNESEYNEILRQAVAVIENAKSNAARVIVSTSNKCTGALASYYMSANSIAHTGMV